MTVPIYSDWNEKGLPEAEAFFGKIANVLENFASEYNLVIDKYYHHSPDWTFRFKHPEGGVGNISVLKCDERSVWIGSSWWLDNYEENIRYSKDIKCLKYDIEFENLKEILRNNLDDVLSWRKEDLGPGTKNPYDNWKEIWTKKEFEKQSEKYPIPKID